MTVIHSISLDDWQERYAALQAGGLREPWYGGPLARHVDDGDTRLRHLRYDPSAASLRLWNFLLTEESRLREAKASGRKIVGAMKDLGTVPVLAFAFPELVAMYPDGAWWIPCVMEVNTRLLGIADSLGFDESFCPVRAMLGAFVSGDHFPIPDLLVCSVGATCDDFSAIAQGLNGLGYPILWWEIPHRRRPDPGEAAVILPGGMAAPRSQVELVELEFGRIQRALEQLAGRQLSQAELADGIRQANRYRRGLAELRDLVYGASPAPLPALEIMIMEMIALHFCSDRAESLVLLDEVLAEVRRRVAAGEGTSPADAVRVYWVNPVADLRMMNLFEEVGGRLAGADFMFTHSLQEIPEDLPPLEALARTALADPMAGPASDRADFVIGEMRRYGAEALAISRIPGGSHCTGEAEVIRRKVSETLGVPVVEFECPSLIEGMEQALRTRLQALMETARARRK